MQANMMRRPLRISSILDHAARVHGRVEVVSYATPQGRHAYTYADMACRARRLARALVRAGIREGDRVATLALNSYRHLELYFAVPAMGAVCHTMNPRLHPQQLAAVLAHADDKLVFFDLALLPLAQTLAASSRGRRFVALCSRAELPADTPDITAYEDLIDAENDDFVWPDLAPDTAASLCYTSGTTGMPKGALYSHEAVVLHALSACMADTLALSMRDVVCPVVPMFHVNGWGIPFGAPLTGAKLVLCGPLVDGASLHDALQREEVSSAFAVATVWFGLLEHMQRHGLRLPALRRVAIGGAPVPPALMQRLESAHGIQVIQGWGMTEIAGLGAMNGLRPQHVAAPQRYEHLQSQGFATLGIEMRVVDEADRLLPHDGQSRGELLIRGASVIGRYYCDAQADAQGFTADGWLRTGDVASIDGDGYLRIHDRSKDMVKSGGEWISSLEIENAAMEHADVAEAAVIAAAHERWGERPLLLVVKKPNSAGDAAAIKAHVASRVARIAVPEAVLFVESLPRTSTGKVQKAALRESYGHHLLSLRQELS